MDGISVPNPRCRSRPGACTARAKRAPSQMVCEMLRCCLTLTRLCFFRFSRRNVKSRRANSARRWTKVALGRCGRRLSPWRLRTHVANIRICEFARRNSHDYHDLLSLADMSRRQRLEHDKLFYALDGLGEAAS